MPYHKNSLDQSYLHIYIYSCVTHWPVKHKPYAIVFTTTTLGYTSVIDNRCLPIIAFRRYRYSEGFDLWLIEAFVVSPLFYSNQNYWSKTWSFTMKQKHKPKILANITKMKWVDTCFRCFVEKNIHRFKYMPLNFLNICIYCIKARKRHGIKLKLKCNKKVLHIYCIKTNTTIFV